MPVTGNHLVQVVGHVRLCRLTRVNAAFQSPFRPESPLLMVLAECPSCGPGNALANVGFQVPALRQFRDKFGCVSKLRESPDAHNGLVPRCGCAPHALSNFQIGYFLSSSEKPTGVSKAKEAPEPCSIFPRVDSKVVVVPFEVCQGSARGCVALGVLVAVVDVARADPRRTAGKDPYRVGALISSM